MSVCLCGQCLEDSSNHCPFPVECFGGWGKGEPGETRGWGGQHGRGRGGTGGKGPGGGGGGGGGGGHGWGRTGRGGARRVHYAPGSH
jgi:hypothetical protein